MNKKRFYRFGLKKHSAVKRLLLITVSLLLAVMTFVSATMSWIEDVSQVEFSSTDGQETPLHIGSKILYSDAVMKKDPAKPSVNLSEYFQESGDMHLSPCYSDGENFYFPQEGNSGAFRVGTKDDANVNYISITFRVLSEGASTAYWFEKTGSTPYVSFKKGDSTVSGLDKFLRCSITVDGATNVYAIDDGSSANGYSKSYKTVENNAVTTKTGRSVEEYTYYDESFNNSAPELYYKNSANKTNKPNQGAGDNLNGNTLFTVNKYDEENKAATIKTVTLKIWLEFGGYTGNTAVKPVDVSNINLNIVSGWDKTRRIYVKDSTILQEGYAQAKWLSHNGSSNVASGLLYWAITGQESSLNWKMTRVSSTSDFYYVNVPAVYNNVGATLYRRSGTTWSSSSVWDTWATTFPNTFHSETYTVYSKQFGTWETADNVHCVYFANSACFTNVYDYMWDSNSIHGSGINDKVVKNANWPGLQMTTLMKTKTSSQSLDTYAFFYNSDYDRIIFNDGDLVAGANQEYQTQDLWLTDNQGNPLNLVDGTFDMTTLTWFHTNPTKGDWSTKMPSYSGSTTYIWGNFSTNNVWKKTRFAYGGEYVSTTGNAFKDSSSTHMLCKIYCKAGNDYEFKLCYNGNWYGAYNDGDKRVTPNSNYYIDGTLIPNNYGLTLDNNHTSNFIVKGINAGDVLRIYFDTNEMKLYFAKGEN